MDRAVDGLVLRGGTGAGQSGCVRVRRRAGIAGCDAGLGPFTGFPSAIAKGTLASFAHRSGLEAGLAGFGRSLCGPGRIRHGLVRPVGGGPVGLGGQRRPVWWGNGEITVMTAGWRERRAERALRPRGRVRRGGRVVPCRWSPRRPNRQERPAQEHSPLPRDGECFSPDPDREAADAVRGAPARPRLAERLDGRSQGRAGGDSKSSGVRWPDFTGRGAGGDRVGLDFGLAAVCRSRGHWHEDRRVGQSPAGGGSGTGDCTAIWS